MENELFESCKTRTVTVKKPFKLKTVKVDGKKRLEEERIEYAEEQVVVPANVTAQIFYLKNRRPNKWKDRSVESIEENRKNDMQTVEDDPITKSLKEEFKK
nr:MAG TPA: terminase small subunit [Siphoviridae sp. ctAeS79]